ncbi:MAG: chromosomal replication initiator protein DnaA [Candidatus Beckwithbacteria bacterium]|nr:chromosomal replication initiator protein DnaA [Candidatus Beckwithbacteria bacterium]
MDKGFLWTAILSEMELNLSPGNFATWIGPIRCLGLKEINKNGFCLELGCPSVFHKNQVGERYLGQIQAMAEKNLGKRCEIKLNIEQKEEKKVKRETNDLFSVDAAKLADEAYRRTAAKAGLTLGFTFENFAVSSSNEVAYAAAKTAANKPGEIYHLIFIFGGVGVGKTHLMQAVGHEILKKNPDTSLVYCTGEEFTNEIIEAIRNKTTALFRQKYRKAKMLFLDDVQFIAGKEKVQEEFFHTFNAVQKEGGQIILTSDRLPTEISGLEDRLRSRFEGGLTVDIQKPEFELRTAILLIKAQQKKIELPMRVAQVVAANVESVRGLEGILMRLYGEQQTRKEPLTEELAMALLNRINGEAKQLKNRLNPKQILGAVSDYYQVKPMDLRGESRLRALVLARQVAMYLLRRELFLPQTAVGALLGGRDHTTIIHGEGKIAKDLGTNEQLRLDVTNIRKNIYKQSGQQGGLSTNQ